jgi:Holliday junction resolvase RusA-like endonuclease
MHLRLHAAFPQARKRAVTLQIVIPGLPQSGNHAKVSNGHGGQVRTEASREYDRRIVSIAKAAVVIARWKIPDYVRVDMHIVNCRNDRENVMKEVHDPLQGIVFHHDSRILDGRVIKCKDNEGPRVVLQISEVDGALYGFAKPRNDEHRAERDQAARFGVSNTEPRA